MNPLTIEWVDKAEGDFTTALRELRARKSPNKDTAREALNFCQEVRQAVRLSLGLNP